MSYGRDRDDDHGGSDSRADQLFVGRLPLNTTARDLEDRFNQYGKITRCDVKSGTNTAYAFIKYEDRKDAEDAMKSENGAMFEDKAIVIEWSSASKGGGGRGRGRGRGRGGGGYGRDRNGGGGRDYGYSRGGRDSYGGGGRDDYRYDDYDSRGRSRYDDYHGSSRPRSRSGERYY